MKKDEENFDNELLIVVGAWVILNSNLWTNVGLLNGSLGVVEHIVYNPRTSPLEPPTYVLVRFDNYVGVPWDELLHQTFPLYLPILTVVFSYVNPWDLWIVNPQTSLNGIFLLLDISIGIVGIV